MSRKPNSNSVLKSLPQGKRKEIFERFQNTEWRELLHQLKAEGIETSKTALYDFRSWYEALQPILEANDFAHRFAETLAADKGLSLDVVQINKVAQAAFEMQSIQRQDPALFVELQRLRVQQGSNDIKRANAEQKLREYEDKISAAKAALQGAVSKGGISPETLATIEEAVKIL